MPERRDARQVASIILLKTPFAGSSGNLGSM
jgi:hypothetical protein